MRSIQFLLTKYETKQPGEQFVSTQLRTKYNNKEWRMKQKIRTTQNIMNRLGLQGSNREMCIHLVKNIPLKDLHHTASCETIITAICWYVKKTNDSKSKLEDYNVCKENKLDYKTFSLILCRLCDYYRKNSYLK